MGVKQALSMEYQSKVFMLEQVAHILLDIESNTRIPVQSILRFSISVSTVEFCYKYVML
jgi:hypothetical protein